MISIQVGLCRNPNRRFMRTCSLTTGTLIHPRHHSLITFA